MRLKRVRIFGFKTFAEKAEFDIDGGIVAVVGPNGCGKSNLVDAILWGLGEGSAKHLRAQTGADVIFNGSSRKKSLGFAEVSLLFDNEDGSLPIDTSEVTISRKMNRSGESDYRINHRPCRQRDIYELLADSGLGRSGYAIVGQKEIDSALAASPEDRRAWVDEAAGVQRYRARKQESQRRLDTAKLHLQRVADVMRELEVQREPLREEAEVAGRYRSVMDTLRSMEVGLLVKELSTATREVTELAAQIDQAVHTSREEIKRAEKAEEKSRRVSEQLTEIEQQIEALWSVQQGGLMSYERAESDLKLAQQRLDSLNDSELVLGQEADHIKQRVDDAIAELESLKREVAAEEEALGQLRIECGGAGEEAKSLAAIAAEIEKELEHARQLHTRRLKLEAEGAHRVERIRQAKREMSGIDSSLPELEVAVREAHEALEGQSESLRAAQERIQTLEVRLQDLRETDDAEAVEIRSLLSEKAALEGRIKGIEATIDGHEGLAQGSKAVLDAVQKKELKGNYLPVGQAIETDKEYALAIETVLGAGVNDLIVQTDVEAKAAIAWLKENRAGRATFQALPLMREPHLSGEFKQLLQDEAVVGRASDLIRCEDVNRPVIESLLGRVLVVDDVDSAMRLAKTQGWNRMVTLDGEVVHSGGAVTGGRTAKASYGLVQRKADLAEMQTALGKVVKSYEQAEKKATQRQSDRERLNTDLLEARKASKTVETEAEEAKQFHGTLSEEMQAALRSKGRLAQELEALESVVVEEIEAVDLAAVEAKRDDILRALAAKSTDAATAENRLRDAESRYRQAQIRLEGGAKRLSAAHESETHRQRRLVALGPERERMQGEIRNLEKLRAKADLDRETSESKMEGLKHKKQVFVEESHQFGVESREARANSVAITESLHRCELARARGESKRAVAAERLIEEYGISEEDALAAEGQTEVPADAAALVTRLRRELKAMGPVNLGAIEAYERLTERVDELTAQRADIEGGIEQVLAGIREMDNLTREKFVTTFEQIQVAFSELFQVLFGGGEGKLTLTDPTAVLETGIDIDVVLPGKKRQRLELLSGGERSLCACAFLFSLLRVKPSPLVVLDEVDAPLDGRNVERFVKLLQDFVGTTQFIVVTHNPTTIESAPVWLGVTMQEPGISTLAPMRVPLPALQPAPRVLAVASIEEREDQFATVGT
jgi:chromosome segregation protein